MTARIIRTASIVGALLVMAFTTVVAASVRGGTVEVMPDSRCIGVVWPMIPADCLSGDGSREVRLVSVGGEVSGAATQFDRASEPMAAEFAGKSDRLPLRAEPQFDYVIVETRGDGISLLSRFQVEKAWQSAE